MSDTPHTVDDLLDLWDDHAAPCESQMRHPSMWTPRRLRVVGSPWTVEEVQPGYWAALHNGTRRAEPNHLTDVEAFRLVCLLAEQTRVEPEGPRPAEDRRSLLRGLGWAVPASAVMWAVAIWAAGRIGGAW